MWGGGGARKPYCFPPLKDKSRTNFPADEVGKKPVCELSWFSVLSLLIILKEKRLSGSLDRYVATHTRSPSTYAVIVIVAVVVVIAIISRECLPGKAHRVTAPSAEPLTRRSFECLRYDFTFAHINADLNAFHI